VVGAEPPLSAAPVYQLVRGATGGPVITDGQTVVLAWPASIPTYTSGENPAANPFGVDNAVVGQTGRWVWAALKGPKNPPPGIPDAVWGYRRWDRLVALNLDTSRYAVYAIPADGSEALYGPLWEHPPVFGTLPSGDGLVALGHWAAVVPADPAGVASLRVLGRSPTTPSAALQRQAARLVNQQAWDSINADAAFWNCYVMADPSTAACPHGASVFGGTALSMQPTYFNHGDLGFGLLWAMTLPITLPSLEQSRASAEALLAKGLAGSYMMSWIAYPSAAEVRAHFNGQPPYPLPGYTRRQGYYWATTAASAATQVPGIGSLPPANLSGSHIAVSVTKVLTPTQLVVNGRPVNPPSAQAEPVVVEMTITPTANGVIVPVPSFGFATLNAAAATAGLDQIAYYAGSSGAVWQADATPDQGVPPRLVLGTTAISVWAVGWIERPASGTPAIAILWDGTPSGRPGGVIATVQASRTGAFSLRT
jgi:hypothetical protein